MKTASTTSQTAEASEQSIAMIHYQGKFIHECRLPGEGRDRDTFPAHPNGIQLSKDRFLLTFSTRTFRGRDDEKSVVYQLRAGDWFGPILKEGFIQQTRDDWDALGTGQPYVLQCGHVTGLGVPKGALVDGKRVAHENLFVLMWRICARYIDPSSGYLTWTDSICMDGPNVQLDQKTRRAMWMQIRLNDAENDIEIVEPAAVMAQKGYDAGGQVCEQGEVESFIKSYVNPVPLTEDASQWIDMNTVSASGKKTVMPNRYAYNSQTHRYEWVESGSLIDDRLFEANVSRFNGDFVFSSRELAGSTGLAPEEGQRKNTVTWWRMNDPFGDEPVRLVKPESQWNWHPLTAYTCADGRLRRFGGCIDRSPHNAGRNPLYMVDIDPDNDFEATQHRVLADLTELNLPRHTGSPKADFPKLLTHTGGLMQTLLFRICPAGTYSPARPDRLPSCEEMAAAGIYRATIQHHEPQPGAWTFADDSANQNG